MFFVFALVLSVCFRELRVQIFCSYAGAIFADACLKGLNGVPDVVECSFVQSSVTELPFFASKVSELVDSDASLKLIFMLLDGMPLLS